MRTVVPSPSVESISARPPAWAAKPVDLATGRGRCPCRLSLVVKNGSKARLSTSGACPSPVSVTVMQTSADRRSSQLRRAEGQLAAVRHCVAGIDRGVEQRRFRAAPDRPRPAAGPAGDRASPRSAAQHPAEHFGEGVEPDVEVEHLRLQRLAPAEGEQMAGQRRSPARRSRRSRRR